MGEKGLPLFSIISSFLYFQSKRELGLIQIFFSSRFRFNPSSVLLGPRERIFRKGLPTSSYRIYSRHSLTEFPSYLSRDSCNPSPITSLHSPSTQSRVRVVLNLGTDKESQLLVNLTRKEGSLTKSPL